MSHFGGCAVLFIKDTFFPDVEVKSIYRHSRSGWRRYHVARFLSLTTAQRPKILHSDASPYQQQFCHKAWHRKTTNPCNSRCVLEDDVDVVAGDFTTPMVSVSLKRLLPTMPPGPKPLWCPGAVPGTWVDVCGCLKPLDSDERWKHTSTWCPFHSSRSSRHPPDRSELPLLGMTPGFC